MKTPARHLTRACLGIAGALLCAGPAAALDGKGPLRIEPRNGWKAFEVISEGDDPAGDGHDFALPQSFDGTGAYLVGRHTLRVLVNHETADASISEVDLALADVQLAIEAMLDHGALDGQTFVRSARQAYDRWSSDGGKSWIATTDNSTTNFQRLCSGQSYRPNSFGSGRGFVDLVYLTGEETANGRLFVLDAGNRDLYQLSEVVGAAPGGNAGLRRDTWENAALIDTRETDHVALLLSADGGTRTLQLYVGEKGKDRNGDASDGFLARNGLAYGSYYYLAGRLPDGGATHSGTFQTNQDGALSASKMEDIDTSPSDPSKLVLANQLDGVFVLAFDLDFSDGFVVANSGFSVTEIANQGSGDQLDNPDNLDWTAATLLDGLIYPNGLIFINEDNASGQIWQLDPDGTNPGLIGSTTIGAESSGILDISGFFAYAPGSVVLTNNQGVSSMTLLLNPATTLQGPCGDMLCTGDENPQTCPEDCMDIGEGDTSGSGDGDSGPGSDASDAGCTCGVSEPGERGGALLLVALFAVGSPRLRRR